MMNMNQVLVGMVLAAMLATGCQQPTHRTQRAEAQQEWRDVRAQVKVRLAQQQFDAGQFEEATITAVEAIALQNNDQDAYRILTYAQLELDRIQGAERSLNSAKRAGVWTHELANAQGIIAEHRGDYTTALEAYRQANTLSPQPQVQYIAAQVECYVSMGQPETALQFASKNFTKFPHDATLFTLAGHVANMMGKHNDAREFYGKAVALVPPTTQLPMDYGCLLVRAGRYGEAMSVLRPFYQSRKGEITPAARRALAACYIEQDKSVEAINILHTYTRENPNDVRANVLLAKAAIDTNRMSLATRSMEAARKHDPLHPEVLFTQAVVQWRTNNLDDAVSTLKTYARIRPGDADGQCLMGEIMRTRGDTAAARAYFRRAMQIEPNNKWANSGWSITTKGAKKAG
jgi:Flp pilus assembly protein TadD